MDLNAGCSGTTWIFPGAVTSTGLNSKSHPGHFRTGSGASGTWYAVKA